MNYSDNSCYSTVFKRLLKSNERDKWKMAIPWNPIFSQCCPKRPEGLSPFKLKYRVDKIDVCESVSSRSIFDWAMINKVFTSLWCWVCKYGGPNIFLNKVINIWQRKFDILSVVCSKQKFFAVYMHKITYERNLYNFLSASWQEQVLFVLILGHDKPGLFFRIFRLVSTAWIRQNHQQAFKWQNILDECW